jgi:tetratricopeptide (TPR) repeat protein
MAVASTARAPWALLVAFTACFVYACFARGASDLPAQSWTQLALALVATAAVAAWLYGNGLTLRASRTGAVGLAGIVLFAAWAVVSIAYSVAPDRSWAEANTVLAYAIAGLIGVLLGSSLPRAAERVGLAIGIATIPVALYALGGKTLPGLHLGGLIDLDHTADFNRLRAPLGYWNALALICVAGALPLLRAAADPHRRPWPRVAGVLGVHLLVLVLGMTYSRGGILALVAGSAVLVALSTERVRTLLLLGSAVVAALPPLAIALTRDDLTRDLVPLAQRTGDSAAVLVAALLTAVALGAWARWLIALEGGPRFTPARGRAWGRPVARGAAAVLAVALLAFVVTGAAGRTVDAFVDRAKAPSETDPNRLLSTNAGNRWIWWKEAAGAFSDKPVAGWGAGSFPVTHRLYRKNALAVQQPHSVPLQWLAEDGLVGFVIALAALAGLFAAALSRVRALPWALSGAPPDRGAAAALLAIAVAWAAQALFEWSWDIPAVTLPVFLALGTLAARPGRMAPAPVEGRGAALIAATVACVLYALSCALPAIARVQTDAALATAGAADVSDDRLADAAAQAELAARLNPLAIDGLVAEASIALRRDRTEEANRVVLRAVRRQPYDPDLWVRLTLTQAAIGDRAAARRAALRAVALDPRDAGTVDAAVRAFAQTLLANESATATGAPLPP